MNEPGQGLKFGLTVIIAAVSTAVTVTLFGLGEGINFSHQEDVRHETEMREYRRFMHYNGKIVPTADVIGTILFCRGNPLVRVVQKSGGDFTWSPEQLPYADTFYSQSALSEALPIGAKFHCTVGKDGNGIVFEILFEEV